MDAIQSVGAYAGAIVTIIGLVVMIIKPVRKYFVDFIVKTTNSDDTAQTLTQILDSVNKLSTQNTLQSEALLCVIRNTIVHLYYQYKPIGEISAYEKENIEKLYKTYTALGGNSFVTNCVEEMRKMPTKM